MSSNLTKKDIVQCIYNEVDVPQKDVREVVQKTLDCIVDALHEGKNVELRNFGVFELKQRKSRIGRNPGKPEQSVVIPERTVVRFKPGRQLKEGLKNK